MRNYKKSLFYVVFLIIVSSILTACGDDGSSKAEGDTIKLGVLEDRSGDFALVGIQKSHAVELAVEEINDNGGLLGKQIEIVAPDTQSDDKRFQEMARKLILKDKVDVIMGAFSSASREAIRPIMEENKMLYFYNNQYEGGVASKYTFPTGAVPEHQVMTVMEYMIENYGSNVYTIAADYNFGQITADWVRMAAEDLGGKIVGEEFIPLGESQFNSSINKIQKAKPDFLIVLLTGEKQSSFYEQWNTQGIKDLPMATTINMAQQYEHIRSEAPALAHMHVAAPFMEEMDTPEAKEFVEKFRKKFPDDDYVGMEAEAQYTGVNLWAKAVEQAGTTDVDKVIAELENGLSWEAPSGKVTIDPKSHHAVKDVYLFYADENHKISTLYKWDQVEPFWLHEEKGIDLTQDSPNQQYTPID
ncbi:urea ABC transporter substrate-binding protein [Sporosarcina cascadiensis]|uniref:urea ABC transporter substrate-binding protein n=1 Tax=Sporosarcina cascadiensis TaxID=2660747 RepID=UPI00129B3B01|nr:urea ABC transporter substrate-binding protein [Sporosarcina cascadiensis]